MPVEWRGKAKAKAKKQGVRKGKVQRIELDLEEKKGNEEVWKKVSS